MRIQSPDFSSIHEKCRGTFVQKYLKEDQKIHLDITMNLSAFCGQSWQVDVTVASPNTLLRQYCTPMSDRIESGRGAVNPICLRSL